MQSPDKSSLLGVNQPSNHIDNQNIQNESIISSKNEIFTLLLRSIFILVFLAILFIAAIYYGIINP